MNLITHPDAKFSEEKIYHFKKTFFAKKPTLFSATAFADARYKLYLNGNLIALGPCHGNRNDLYYDTIENSQYLVDGENLLEAVVLQLKNEFDGEIAYANLGSVLRTGNIRFALQGTVTCADKTLEIETDDSWETAPLSGIDLIGDHNYTVGLNEYAHSDYFAPKVWTAAKTAGFCANYDAPKENVTQRGRYSVMPAPVPPQRLDPVNFTFDADGICDAGEYMNAYLKYTFSGKGTVRLTYAECKVVERDGEYVKEDRTCANGLIVGYYDTVEVDAANVVYEPFWFRAFRFIKADITGDVKIEKVEGFDTGYPLDVKGKFSCDSETDCKLWDISLRTLKRCMLETYNDCPYYEQEQYLMDTRMQILYTYYVSGDDKMVRRTLRDFASVQQADGLVLARTPDVLPQIIPGFALYYIFILYDHYTHFGDLSLVKSYLHVVDGILHYFSEHLSEKGLVKQSGFWDFIDWADGWIRPCCILPLEKDEELSIYTLMYATALKRAAVLHEALGNYDTAHHYICDANLHTADVKTYCFDEEKSLFADGPNKKLYSMHAQIWAVLSGAVDTEMGRTILQKALSLKAQPTYSYSYDYFRALEMCGMYEERSTMLKALRKLIALNSSTIPEEPNDPRSECHGWGAIVLYEYAASDVGLRVDEPNHMLYVKPYIHEFNHAEATVPFCGGLATAKWKKENDTFTLSVQAPKGYITEITMPDGSVSLETDESITLTCKI